MADFSFPQPKNPALDKPEKKRRKPILAILTAALIIILALLLLCLIPGKPVLSLVLPIPKPVVVPLESLAFQEITPPAGGGVSQIIFPVPGTGTTPPPTCPSNDPVCLPPVTPPPITPPPTTPPPTTPPPTTPPPTTPPPGTPPPTTPPPTGEPSNLMDRGDAPDIPAGHFPSLDKSKGARHKDVSRFYLGEKVDKEVDSHQVDKDSPNPAIGGDDGLIQVKVIPNIAAGGVSVWELTIKVKNEDWEATKPIFLNVLYDLNGDSDWNDLDERVLADKEFLIQKGGTAFYTIPIVNPDCCILNWVRLSVTDIKLGANYNGSWPVPFEYGETEDHFASKAYPPHYFFTSWVHWPPNSEPRVVHVPPSWTGTPTGRIVAPKDFSPGVMVPGKLPRITPAIGVDVPSFDPGRYRPIVSKDGKSIIGFHETATTKGIRVKPFGTDLLPGQPPFTGTPEFPPQLQPIQQITVVISRGPEGGVIQVVANRVFDALRSLFGQGFVSSTRNLKTYTELTFKVPVRQPVLEVLRTITVPVLQPPKFITVPAQTGVPPVVPVPEKVCNIVGESPTSSDQLFTVVGECTGYNSCSWAFTGLSRTGQVVYGLDVPNTDGKNRRVFKYPEGTSALQVKAMCDATSVAAPLSISPFGLQAGGGTSGAAAGGGGCGTITVSASPAGPYNVTGPLPVAIGEVTMSGSGGTTPYTYTRSSGSLPPTTSIISSTGVISGSATTAGNYTATITATDANSCTGTADVNFNVSEF